MRQQSSTEGHESTEEHKPITDLATFERETLGRYQIAGLYFYQQLDCLVDLAHKVSADFFARPNRYKELGKVGETPMRQILAELHARSGYNELFPSNAQRDDIFTPIFGSGGAYSATEEGNFPRLRAALTGAAAAFAERVFNTGEEMLRERFRAAARIFRQYLEGLGGESIKWSRENALSDLTENFAYAILRSKEVAGVFGINAPPKVDWPYTEDSNGDKLVEAISIQLRSTDSPGARIVTLEEILNRQRAALRGAEAIARLIDFKEEASNEMITLCYSWNAALLSLGAYTSAGEVALRVYPGSANRTSETR